MHKFSLNLLGFNVINYFSRNGDNFLVGKFLGASALGWYAFAYNLMLLPILNVTNSISRVLFPVLSKFQDDQHSFRDIYLKVVRYVAFFAFPIVMGIIAISKPFFMYFLGAKWLPALPVVYILTPMGFLQSILSLNGAIYSAKGRTDLLFRYNVIFTIIILASFVVGLRWGITGMASAYVISATFIAYPNIKIPYKLIDLPLLQMFKVIRGSFLCTVLMGVSVFLLSESLDWSSLKWFKLSLLFVTGITSYILFTLLWNRETFMSLIGLLKNYKKIEPASRA